MTIALCLLAIGCGPARGGFAQPVIPPPRGGEATPETNIDIGRRLAEKRGWIGEQFACLVRLWSRESGWDELKSNYAGSGAYGIPQALPGSKMQSAGPEWRTDAATQIRWGLGYISGRFGSPCDAWAHSNTYGWY